MNTDSSYGPVIGLIIIVLIIALGSVFFLQQRESNEQAPDESALIADNGAESVSDSNEIADLEAELTVTDVDTIDAELGNIDAELAL